MPDVNFGEIPFSYEEINIAAGLHKPGTQKSYNNETFAYWARALFERAAYSMDITLPDEWQDDKKCIFYWWLFIRGFLVIYEEPEMGLVFQPCTVNRYDFYYRPVEAIVCNPYVPAGQPSSRTLTIGKDCQLVKLAPDRKGVADIIAFYAEKLSNLSLSVDLSIINTRFAKIMAARNKAAAEALKKVLDKVNSGVPAVIVDEKLLDDRTDKAPPFQEFGIDHLKENYITNLQWQDLRNILSDFDEEIGIVRYDKKERLVAYEAEQAQMTAVPRITVWKDTLNSCFKTVNEMFGTNMQARLRKGGEDGQRNDERPDSVQLDE